MMNTKKLLPRTSVTADEIIFLMLRERFRAA